MAEKNKPEVDKITAENQKPKFGPFSALVATVAIYFGSQIIAAVGFGIYAAIKGLDQSQIETLLKSSTIAQFFYFLATGALILLLLWQFLKFRKLSWSDIGLKKPAAKNFFLAIPIFGAYFITLIVVVTILSKLVTSINLDQEQQIGFEQATGGLALAMVFISLVIIPAVTEEILIRGFLYGGLVKKFSKVAAALLASVIFGIAHLQLGMKADPLWIAAVDTFILSLFLIWLREKTGNIYAGMLVHAIKNSLAFASIFIFHIN